MKIGQEMRSRVEQKTFSKQPEGTKNFNKLVQSQFHKMKREELDQLMQDITKQGEKIARFRSFRDLATFKRMIKQFLEKTAVDLLGVIGEINGLLINIYT